MTLTELLPILKQLSRADKIRALQFLVNEIAREEGILFDENQEHNFISLYDSYDAADKLGQMLKENKSDV